MDVHERGRTINYFLLSVYKEYTLFTDLLTKYKKCKQMILLIAFGIKLIFNWSQYHVRSYSRDIHGGTRSELIIWSRIERLTSGAKEYVVE